MRLFLNFDDCKIVMHAHEYSFAIVVVVITHNLEGVPRAPFSHFFQHKDTK